MSFKVDCLLSSQTLSSVREEAKASPKSRRLCVRTISIKSFTSLEESFTNFLNDRSFPSVHHGEPLSAFCVCAMCN